MTDPTASTAATTISDPASAAPASPPALPQTAPAKSPAVLIDAAWPARLQPALAARLQSLLDTPGG